MNCVSNDKNACTTTLGVCFFSLGVFLRSRVTGACPVTTDLDFASSCENSNNNNNNNNDDDGGGVMWEVPWEPAKNMNMSNVALPVSAKTEERSSYFNHTILGNSSSSSSIN